MEAVDVEDLTFKHPFSMMLSGGRRSGKTFFTKTLLLRNKQFITPQVDWVFWFSPTEQNAVFDELRENLNNIEFVTGLPTEDLSNFVSKRYGSKLIILDDLMEQASKRSDVDDLFTRGRHEDISVIFLAQNGFHQGKFFREISKNSEYIIWFKNLRDATAITKFGIQMNIAKFLKQAYIDATREPFSYLLGDFRSDTDDRLRFRAKIFDEFPVVYLQR